MVLSYQSLQCLQTGLHLFEELFYGKCFYLNFRMIITRVKVSENLEQNILFS